VPLPLRYISDAAEKIQQSYMKADMTLERERERESGRVG